MHDIWTTTAKALPSDGMTVEFLLDERECPLRGIYAVGRFKSRWTHYSPTSVRQWRIMSEVRMEVPSDCGRACNDFVFALQS
ncbi:MAG: hypothetical protein ABIS07_18445 [Dokdonella sp.]